MNLSTDHKRAFLILGAILMFIIAENLYTFLPSIGTSKAYYWTRSFSFVVFAYTLYKISIRPYTKLAAFVLLGLSISDLIDELCSNGEEVNIFEYVSFVVIVILAAIKWYKIGRSYKRNI